MGAVSHIGCMAGCPGIPAGTFAPTSAEVTRGQIDRQLTGQVLFDFRLAWIVQSNCGLREQREWRVHDLNLLINIAVALVAAFAGGLVERRLGLPAIVGYLLAGMAIGPWPGGRVKRYQCATQ